MKTAISSLALAIVACTQQDATAGTWYRILPAGEFKAGDGRPAECQAWVCTPETGQRLAAALKTRKSELVVDYEHQTLNAAVNGKPAPAAGWGKDYRWQDDGLYALLKWTPAAKAMVDGEEYRYLSPVFTYDKTTGEVGEVINVALTNQPALDGLTDTMAKAALSLMIGESTMNLKELLERLRYMLNLPTLATAEDLIAELQKLIAAINQAKGTAATSIDIPALLADSQAVAALNSQVAALTLQVATPDPAKFVSVAVLSATQGELAACKAELAALKDAASGKELDNVIAAALSDGRLLPAQESWARDLGKVSLAHLTSYLGTVQPMAALTTTQTGGKPPVAATPNNLSPVQLAICKDMGLTHDEFIANLSTDK
ncbi:MAG TPA: phage protease [Fluviicoccus sp.]|nr:phage protease [Fluviicoccus sp.]